MKLLVIGWCVLPILISACGNSGGSGSGSSPTASAWDFSCYNSAQGICSAYKMVTPAAASCAGVGQQVNSCPVDGCVAGCVVTDVSGNKVETAYYGSNHGTVSQITAMCTSIGGSETPCQ